MGRDFEFYFADFLISIYGEDILEYAFRNDSIGFLNDDRFKDIKGVISRLDELEDLFVSFKFILASFDKGFDLRSEKFSSFFYDVKERTGNVIRDLFVSFSNEYKHSKGRIMSYDCFVNKIKEFCSCENYDIVFRMGFDGLREDVLMLILKV